MCPTATCGILHNFVEYSNQNSTSFILNEIEMNIPFEQSGILNFDQLFVYQRNHKHGIAMVRIISRILLEADKHVQVIHCSWSW